MKCLSALLPLVGAVFAFIPVLELAGKIFSLVGGLTRISLPAEHHRPLQPGGVWRMRGQLPACRRATGDTQ